jgi:hypothetical protein
MTTLRMLLITAIWLLPAAARAHGAGSHPPDPNLHLDASLEDCSIHFSPELTQSAFTRFAREFGSVSAFKQMSPPTTLGQWNFSLGIEQMWFTVEERDDAWNDTFAHPDAYHELGSSKTIPKLRARVGITDELDVGAYYSEAPLANYGWLGLEAKYGLLKQNKKMPISLALRGAYTKTLYVDDMDMHALGTDVSAGRTFWKVFTPYLGVGNDVVLARETADTVDLEDEVTVDPHVLAGFDVQFWHIGLGAEAQLAALPSFHAQVSAVF